MNSKETDAPAYYSSRVRLCQDQTEGGIDNVVTTVERWPVRGEDVSPYSDEDEAEQVGDEWEALPGRDSVAGALENESDSYKLLRDERKRRS